MSNICEDWVTQSYTVRVPGQSAWADGIESYDKAAAIQAEANRVCQSGHRIYAEQEYVGDGARRPLGTTRTIEVYDY